MTEKIKNPADLMAMAAKAKAAVTVRDDDKAVQVTVHMGTCGIAAGARDVIATFMRELPAAGVTNVTLRQSGCAGLCEQEPMITVRGGLEVLNALKKDLDIDVGETTEDRQFSLEVARCFGACGLAPVLTVGDDVHHRVKPKRIKAILEQYAEAAVAAERSA